MDCDRNCYECANTFMGSKEIRDENKILPEGIEILAPVYSCIKPELGKVKMNDEVPCSHCMFATPVQIPYTYKTDGMSDRQRRALSGCSCSIQTIHCQYDPDNVYRLPTMRCGMGLPIDDDQKPHADCKKVPYVNDVAWNFSDRER